MRQARLQPESIERVVVRGVNWVGDAVMTIPALRELRRIFPNAQITLVTRPWAEGIFADADYIDELLVYDRGSGNIRSVLNQIRKWRERRFDLAILLQNAFEAALIARAARVPVRVGYSTDRRGALLTHPIKIPAWRSQRHEVFYYLNIIAELEAMMFGESPIPEREPDTTFAISEGRKARARAFLSSEGLALNRPLVAFCPGSTNSRAKRWPAERYAALADRFITEAGADVLLIGAADELEVSHEVESKMNQRPLKLTGRTALAEAIDILSIVDMVVTNDTGPAHLAAALGRPTLVIFGPTDPRTTQPYSPSATILRQPPDCAPCMLRDCPIDHRCMTAITPDDVFKQAMAILETRTVEIRR